jgi:hypothetical protein
LPNKTLFIVLHRLSALSKVGSWCDNFEQALYRQAIEKKAKNLAQSLLCFKYTMNVYL